MDPNETLRRLRSLAAVFMDPENEGDVDLAGHLESMCNEFMALDTWLSRQGFLPSDWSR